MKIYDDTDPIIDVYYAKVRHRAKTVARYIADYKTACLELGIEEPWIYKAELGRQFPEFERMYDAILAQLRDDGVIDYDDWKPAPMKLYCRAAVRIEQNLVPYNTESLTAKPNNSYPTMAVSENYFR
jgi:hypothetical protein